MIYDLIKTNSKEEFVKAVQYFEYLGHKNESVIPEDWKTFPIVVVDSMGEINAWKKAFYPLQGYNEISIPAEFLNKEVYTKEEAMEKFNCIIL